MPFQSRERGPCFSHSDSPRHSSSETTRPVQVSGCPATDTPCRNTSDSRLCAGDVATLATLRGVRSACVADVAIVSGGGALISGTLLSSSAVVLTPSDTTDITDETSFGGGFVGCVSCVPACWACRAAASHRVMTGLCAAQGSRRRGVAACRPADLEAFPLGGCTRHLRARQVPGRGHPWLPAPRGRAASPAAR